MYSESALLMRTCNKRITKSDREKIYSYWGKYEHMQQWLCLIDRTVDNILNFGFSLVK